MAVQEPTPLLPTHSGQDNGGPVRGARHAGYDNCKMIFMMLVVLWHTAHLDILDKTFFHSSVWDGTTPQNPNNKSFFDREEYFRHAHWTPFLMRLTVKYWRWTELVAVPGFAFLSGFFGKGFLPNQNKDADPEKDRDRWEKTIITLVVAPLILQVFYIIAEAVAGEGFPAKFPVWNELVTWYLFVLLLWRVFTTLFLSRIQQTHCVPLLVSFVLAFVSVHTARSDPQEVTMRVLFFFPFYVAGLYWKESTWTSLVCTFCRLTQSRENPNQACRIVGMTGIVLTIAICYLIPDDFRVLGWWYSINNWEWKPHLCLLLQYVLSFTAIISVILVVKTIPVSLFPFGHACSTLAVYEWHWSIAVGLAWGIPFSTINSPIQYMFSHWSPLPAVVGAHMLSYMICVFLGNKWLWQYILRHLCDPQWCASYIFPSRSTGEQEETV